MELKHEMTTPEPESLEQLETRREFWQAREVDCKTALNVAIKQLRNIDEALATLKEQHNENNTSTQS